MKRYMIPPARNCDGGALTVNNPEPLDEYPAGAAEEKRGGDRREQWTFPEYDENGTFPYLEDPLLDEDK